jgi:hypothetical protein
MTWAERNLVLFLRACAALLLLALVPVVMPFAWMDAVHRAMGLGELPDVPIVGYLTRSASALYAMHGGLVLFLSFDVRRYRPVIVLLAALCLPFGVAMVVLDAAVGMPAFWTACEGPVIVTLGCVLLYLASKSSK